ncbi:hypothetical protein DFS34DRAFT_617304 [Phlyctochytrium arcticum]|nr:hypothetical protein DFS34DRAFT_617304 [Phlyctochytrium arcticum]
MQHLVVHNILHISRHQKPSFLLLVLVLVLVVSLAVQLAAMYFSIAFRAISSSRSRCFNSLAFSSSLSCCSFNFFISRKFSVRLA